MKIIGVVTTKNRFEYFERAFRSAISQKRKLDQLIVVSDSEVEVKESEKRIAENASAIFLEDKYTHNYAGLHEEIEAFFKESGIIVAFDDLTLEI